MKTLRELITGLLLAAASSAIVMGALALSLSETLEKSPLQATITTPTAVDPTAIPGTSGPAATQTPAVAATSLPLPTSFIVTAASPTSCIPPSGWNPYIVLVGDRLEDLAALHQVSVDEIKQANCLLTTSLLPGTILYLPPFVATPTPVRPTATSIPCGPPPGWVRYIIQPGDTLFKLSLVYSVSVPTLAYANCLLDATYIRAGDVLYVPPVLPPSITPTRTVTPTVTVTRTATTLVKTNTSTGINSILPAPSLHGQAVTVGFSVVSNPPGGFPTGNVTVSDGSASCTATVAAGSCVLTLTGAGTHNLTAVYAGDAGFNGSTSPAVVQTVNKASTLTTITSHAPDPSVTGQAITVSFTVGAVAPGSGTPTGNVTVSNGVDSCTATVAAGSCSLVPTSAGTQDLTAVYAGDVNFNGSSSTPVSHTVNPAGTTTTITGHTPDPSSLGEAVLVSFNVLASLPGSGTPTGNVTISDGVDTCTATVAAGSCSLALTTSGTRTLTASYAGDGNFNASVSTGVEHTVN